MLNDLVFCTQKIKSNLIECTGTTEAAEMIRMDLHPWLFLPEQEYLPRLLDRLDDPRDIDPLEFTNWMTIVILHCPIVLAGMMSWGRGDLPRSLAELPLQPGWAA